MSQNWGDIVEDILEHIENCTRRNISSYYVGTSEDPKKSLFDYHNISETEDCWVYRKAQSLNDAKIAEQELIEMGMDGIAGKGGSKALYVYCFEITQNAIT